MIIATNDISQGGKTFFNSLDDDGVRKGIAEVLEFLVGCGGGDEEASFISDCCAADETASSYCGVDYGDVF